MPYIAQLLAAAMLAFATPSDAPSSATVAFAAEIGITPEALVVAGFSANDVQTLVDNLGTDSESKASLASAQTLVATKQAAFASAKSALAASPSSSELRTALNAARGQLVHAEEALVTARATLRAAALVSQTQERKDAVATYLAAAGRVTAPEFKAISRSEADWIALEGALRAEARATRLGQSLAETQATLLLSARANSTVSTAKTRLDSNLATAKAIFVPAS